MLSPTQRTRCRVHVGAYCLDRALPGNRSINALIALVAALALLAALLPLASLAGDWLSQTISVGSGPDTVQLSTPRVPTREVQALERIDLSIVVDNPTSRRLENVTLEIMVLKPDGSSAMVSQQSHITLQPHDSRAIYWAWRVPAQLPTGAYSVVVNAFDTNGRLLTEERPAKAAMQIVGRETD